MKKVYINGIAAISAQRTWDGSFFENIEDYQDTILGTKHPEYKEFIAPAAARRMATGIKMGIAASKIAMKEAEVETVDAIITGTGLGCVIDSEKFVSAMIDNKEEYLTPTSFIQSTHNTVAGQIALGLECKAYNFTYVHSAISFESALGDGQMQIASGEASTILVGGVEELAPHTVFIHRAIDHIKSEPISISGVLNSETNGAVFSEGANFFVLSATKGKNCYAKLMDVVTYNTIEKEHLIPLIENFLHRNHTHISQIDVVVLGYNGDREFDDRYKMLSDGILKDIQQVFYKHLVGENNTVSAFGIWLASKILKTKTVPDSVKINDIENMEPKMVLCYNQYRGKNHSLTLLKKC